MSLWSSEGSYLQFVDWAVELDSAVFVPELAQEGANEDAFVFGFMEDGYAVLRISSAD